MDPGPSTKNQHTADDSNPAKKSQPSRRKSTGNPHHDESRLLKRKEQNRAAQRAFRERKEKHVKDLEDQVAALEAKNEATEAENTNLRDLLSRLQEENLALKEAQFTFSVPKPGPMAGPAPNSTAQPTPFGFFGTPSPFTPTSAPSQSPSNHVEFGTDIDWSSLTTFDPSMLKVLDEPSEVPMQTDTSTSPFGQYALPQSYKTIANNPLLMSFVDEPSSSSFNTTSSTNSLDHFAFNFSSPSNSWTSTAQSAPFTQSNGHADFLHPNQNHSLDELFGGNYMGNQGPIDFNALVDSTSISPVTHANGVKPSSASQKSVSSPTPNSNTSSPSTSTSQSPFWSTLSQPGESPPSGSETTSGGTNASACRPGLLNRTDFAKHIAAEGPSPFSDLANPSLRKTSDVSTGDMVSCQNSNFPRTKESPENIEVLKAWRCITQNPHFKDADINELCGEFSKKARCDGTKVVLEPESVHQLFEHFKKSQQISTQQPPSDRTSS
jgi:AP-1-like factor